jgi:hypothetical protein
MTDRDRGYLLSFEIEAGTGDVLAQVSDIEDHYAHPVRITRTELAGMAEASAEAYRVRLAECTHCHLTRPASELNNFGVCVVCVMSGG